MNLSYKSILEGQLLLLDKPLEWTSFQVVNKVRWALTKKYNLKKLKVGPVSYTHLTLPTNREV